MTASLRDRLVELVSDHIDPDIPDSISDDSLIRALAGRLDEGEAAATRAEALGGALVKIACTLVDAGIYTALDDPETIADGVATLSTRRHALECDATQGCAPGCATVKARTWRPKAIIIDDPVDERHAPAPHVRDVARCTEAVRDSALFSRVRDHFDALSEEVWIYAMMPEDADRSDVIPHALWLIDENRYAGGMVRLFVNGEDVGTSPRKTS